MQLVRASTHSCIRECNNDLTRATKSKPRLPREMTTSPGFPIGLMVSLTFLIVSSISGKSNHLPSLDLNVKSTVSLSPMRLTVALTVESNKASEVCTSSSLTNLPSIILPKL